MITPQEFQETIKQLAANNQESRLLSLLKGTIYYSLAIEEAAKHNHSSLVISLLTKLGIPFNPLIRKSNEELAMLNRALYGYAAGLHFDEVKKLCANGANIFYGLNALLSTKQLNTDNALALIDCCPLDSPERMKLSDIISFIYKIDLSGIKFKVMS